MSVMGAGRNIPGELKYTKDHEWIRGESGRARVGITDFAQSELGDIVFVEFPSVGRGVSAGESVAVVESVKSVSDIYSPAGGTVVAVNDGVDPATVNADPYGAGWLFEIEISSIGLTMTADEYRAYIG